MSKNLPLADQTPAEIDGQLAEIGQRSVRPLMTRARALQQIETYHSQTDETSFYDRVSDYDFQRAEENLTDAEAQLEALRAEEAPLNAEFERRGGWTRFFHVTNANGHVHTSTHCTSCFPDTQYAWRTDLSGLTDEEVVTREAYQACSVCMPIAPAEQKAAFKAHQQQKREDKAREKAVKAAQKEARKLAREESLARKVNKALDKYSADEIQQAWWDGKLTDSAYDVIFDMGKANERKYS